MAHFSRLSCTSPSLRRLRVLRQSRQKRRTCHQPVQSSTRRHQRTDRCEAATVGILLEEQFRSEGFGLDAIKICSGGDNCGLGGFARRDLGAGDLVFTVPQTAMLTESVAVQDSVVAVVASLLKTFDEDRMSELLICLRLCRARVQATDPFHTYATGLPTTAPGVDSWPVIYQQLLANTSLGPLIRAVDAELDHWEALLNRAADADATILKARDVFCRSNLRWARGMVQSRHFPGTFAGLEDERSPCMVPLLDILNHNGDAEVNIQIHGGFLEFRSESAVKAGDQIWNNYDAKGNTELLMCYGFAVESNEEDSVELSLTNADATAPMEVRLSIWGLPDELVCAMEAGEETGSLHSHDLRKALDLRRDAAKKALASLPKLLPCQNASMARFRTQSLEAFLKGQIAVLEICCDDLQ